MKIYCQNCKYFLFKYNIIMSTSMFKCTHLSNTIYKDTPYCRHTEYKKIDDANKNNDCPYFESKDDNLESKNTI